MNTASSSITYFNNSKKNPPNPGKKNKINSLKINVIMNNTAKIRKNDNPDSSNDENDLKRENKCGEKPYDKKNDNENKKVRIAKLNKYYKEKKKFKF